MGSRAWWLVLLCGCATLGRVHVNPGAPRLLTLEEAGRQRREADRLQAEQPRTLAGMTEVARLREAVARSLPDDYDAQWQAAEALAFLAENGTTRIESAKLGLALARDGRQLRPDRVECHYWYAINVGLLADADRSYGLNAVGEMETALRRAGELDERYDFAGPLRVLGILHLRTPAPPVSIGSARKALRLLQRAQQLFPDYPENDLYLAEALRDTDRVTEARGCLQRVLAAAPWPDRQFESAGWQAAATKLLATLPTK